MRTRDEMLLTKYIMSLPKNYTKIKSNGNITNEVKIDKDPSVPSTYKYYEFLLDWTSVNSESI